MSAEQLLAHTSQAPAGPVPLASSVSDLAEELASVIDLNGPGLRAVGIINARIKEHAAAWHRDPMQLTLEVGREWDRLGITRVLTQAGPMGDGRA